MATTDGVGAGVDVRGRMHRGVLGTPVGTLVVDGDGAAIRRVGWVASGSDPEGGLPGGADPSPAEPCGADPLIADALVQLEGYFSGERTRFDLPIDLGAQGDVTRAVLITLFETVGHGETVTYGELAARSGTGVPARAIGSIMGANPIPVIVPCHRVVASDGLGGYSGGAPGQGLLTKRRLLEHEGALPPSLF